METHLLSFFLYQKESVCVDAGIMQWSAINSTFGLHNGQKDRKFACSFFVEYCFPNSERGRQLRKQGQWISFRLLGGARGLLDETGMWELNASALPCNNREGLLTRLPCYWLLVAGILSLRLTDGGGFS